MNTTESNIICTGCDAPFLPTTGDLCARCEQRQADRLCGAKLSAWIAAALVFSLMAAYSKCHGADIHTNHVVNSPAWVWYPTLRADGALNPPEDRLKSYELRHSFPRGGRPGSWETESDFRTKPTEGKARQHEALITTNQTADLGAPANHSAGASVVDEALLNRVAWAESRNNPRAVGKLGEIGIYQLRPIAIREVNRIYGMCFRLQDAKDPVKSREIARLYLLICESRVRVKTPESVYAKYRGKK